MAFYLVIIFVIYILSSIIYATYIKENLVLYKYNKNQRRLLKQIKTRYSKVNISNLEADLNRITNEAKSVEENLSKIKKYIPLTKQTEDLIYLNSTTISDKLLESDETK
jgi:Tfp pilus assembly protein PilO